MSDTISDAGSSQEFALKFDHYCAEGVKNDFQKIVDKFLLSDSVRYEDFLRIWQDMRMVHIFRGRRTELKLKEVCTFQNVLNNNVATSISIS